MPDINYLSLPGGGFQATVPGSPGGPSLPAGGSMPGLPALPVGGGPTFTGGIDPSALAWMQQMAQRRAELQEARLRQEMAIRAQQAKAAEEDRARAYTEKVRSEPMQRQMQNLQVMDATARTLANTRAPEIVSERGGFNTVDRFLGPDVKRFNAYQRQAYLPKKTVMGQDPGEDAKRQRWAQDSDLMKVHNVIAGQYDRGGGYKSSSST